MYHTVRRNLYWPHMADNVYMTVGNCHSSAKDRAWLKRKCHLKQFYASGPLPFITMDIFSLLPRTNTCNEIIIVITDLYTKLPQAIPSSRTTALHVLSIIVDHLIVLYKIPAFFHTESGPQWDFLYVPQGKTSHQHFLSS